MDPLSISPIFQGVFGILLAYWWIWLPVVLFLDFVEAFKSYNREVYLASLKWALYEIKIPIDAHKSLKAMEQIFAGFHIIGQSAPPKNAWEVFKKWRDGFFKGKIGDWLSLEMVGMNGEIHFYVRCIEKYKQLV